MFRTEANPLLAFHFAVRITGHGKLVKLQHPLKSMIFVAEDRIELSEWKDDEPFGL